MDKFLSTLAASLIERTLKGKYSTVGGLLGAAAVSLTQFSPFVPAKYSGYVTLAGAFIASVSAVLAHDSQVKK